MPAPTNPGRARGDAALLYDEATLARVGLAFERATDWHRRRPPLET